MAITDTTPPNLNILSSISFQFFIRRAPHINFFIQTAKVPGIELGVAVEHTPFSNLNYPGEHMEWEDLSIQFLVDEDIKGYFEIFNWLTALGRPDDSRGFFQLTQQKPESSLGIYSDLSLLINDSKRNLNIQCDFEDGFPTALSSMNFDVTQTDLNFMPIEARFTYRRFNIYPV